MPHPHLDNMGSLILALAALLILLLAGSFLRIAPGASSRLRGGVVSAKSPDFQNTTLIMLACLTGVVMAILVYSRHFVFGSKPGHWIYPYFGATASVPPWIPIVVLSLLAVSAFIGSKLILLHERATLFGCFLAAILVQFLIYEIYPVPVEEIVRSDGANGFYSAARQYSPAETLAQYQILAPSLVHVKANMPGKLLLYQLLKAFTSSPKVMGYSVMLLSTFGAWLLYGICKRLFRDKLAAFYAFMLYALIPCRLFFFPILNSVTPLLMLLCLYLFVVYVDRKTVVWLWLLGCALYALVLFEPSPLVTGVIFIGILLIAVRGKRLSRKDLGRLVLHPSLAFLCVYLAFKLLFAFDLPGALRSVLTEAAHFNTAANRRYWPWLGENAKEFLYAAGTPIVIIFVYSVARILCQWRTSRHGETRWSMDAAFALSLLMTFAVVLLLGINRGETSRLWIYLAVLFPIPASLLMAKTPRSSLLFFLVASTLVIQSMVALQRVAFIIP